MPTRLLSCRNPLRSSQSLKFLKLGRILRLLRLSTLWQFLQRFKFTSIFRLIRLFCIYCFVSHWIACLWFATPYVERHWLGRSFYPSTSAATSWIELAGIQDAGMAAQYTTSLYWSFTTIATGELFLGLQGVFIRGE